MKQICCFLLAALLLLPMCGCAAQNNTLTHSEGVVSQPIDGFCGCSGDNKIFISTDPIGYASGELTPPDAGYAYQNGKVIRLTAFDMNLTLGAEVLGLYESKTLPVRYFIFESTVYAYAMEFPGAGVKFVPIPNDREHVLLTGGLVKRELLVNVTDGTYEFLITEFPDYSVHTSTISDDGKYVSLVAGTSEALVEGETSSRYLYRFRDKTLTPLPTPEYDTNTYLDSHSYFPPWYFVGDNFFFTGTFGNQTGYDLLTAWYEFDIKSGTLKERTDLAGFSNEEAQYHPYKHLLVRHNAADGTCSIANLKTSKIHTFDVEQDKTISCSPNESGEYAILTYRDAETWAVISRVFLNVKTGKTVDMSTALPDYQNGSYRGCHLSGLQWCGETSLLLTYSPSSESVDKTSFQSEVVTLPSF